MNPRLRTRLSALVLVAGAASLGLALGEPPRPGGMASSFGHSAVAAMVHAQPGSAAPSDGHAHRTRVRSTQAMPFFSFGARASAGAP